MSEIDRLSTERIKTGVPLGTHIINPFTGRVCPIWAADYAIVDYGTGAVMAVSPPSVKEFFFLKKNKLSFFHVVVGARGVYFTAFFFVDVLVVSCAF